MSGSSERDRHGGRHDMRKRHKPPAVGGGSGDSDAGIELTDFKEMARLQAEQLAAIHSPINSKATENVYDMQKADERERMAVNIWTADFADCMVQLRADNRELMTVLAAQTANTTTQTEISMIHKARQLDGVLLNMVRAQSIHKVPILTVANSLMCEANLVKREFHDSISFLMKGALMSESWVEKFMKQAAVLRPPPANPMIPGVMVTVFDNLTMNVAYKSMCVGGETGEKLDMTNWFAVRVPQALAPTMDGMRTCASAWLEPQCLCPMRHALTRAPCSRSHPGNLPQRPLARRLLPALLPRQRADCGEQEEPVVSIPQGRA